MKNILFPTDFSDNSKSAFEYAVRFASTIGARIHLFHAFHIPYIHAEMPAGMYQSALEEAEKETMLNLQSMCEVVGETSNNQIACQLESRLGFAVDEILTAAENKEIDLIIMGTQGEGNVTEAIFGSIATSVIDKARCPVLAIPPKTTYKPIKNIAFATNFDEADNIALRELSELAKQFDSEIRIVHINEDDEIDTEEEKKYRDRISKHLEYSKITLEAWNGEDVASGLNDFIKTHDVNLICTMRKKRNLFASLFHRSITKKMTFHSHIPVLVYHE